MAHERPSERAFKDLVDALNDTAPDRRDSTGDVQVVVDGGRAARTGVPEIVLAAGKSIEQLLSACALLLESNGRVVVSRVAESQVREIERQFSDCSVTIRPGSRTALIARRGASVPASGGRIAMFAAGASDWPAADEARVVAEEMGCEVSLVVDVGVAGLHRLIRPLRAELDRGVDAIVVAAGMDGALPSVIAGLVSMPVIGLPTSTGYGHGGNGEAALMNMLQSCAPGLTVVNIDNGVGAGASAALIANAAGRFSRQLSDASS
jgi:hypothetical protein